MKTICLLMLIAALAMAVGAASDEAAKTDIDKLSGTWLTVSLVNDGKTLVDKTTPAIESHATKLAYEGNKWMIMVGDKTIASGMISIDATTTPKQIDVLDKSGNENDKTRLGIYELNGDTYTYCIAPAGQPRPTEFTSQTGSGYTLTVSQRERP